MRSHRRIRRLLYEYAQHELPPVLQEEVEAHIRSCARCASELGKTATTITLFQKRTVRADDERPAEYWNEFLFAVEKRIRAEEEDGRKPQRDIATSILPLFQYRKRWMVCSGAVVATAILAIVFWRTVPPVKPEPPHEEIIANAAPVDSTQIQLTQYFRKSKALLVGITNTKTDEERPFDLSLEKKASRSLLREVRSLKRQPLDFRSARLLDDTEKILLGLANMRDHEGAPEVELIRSGIRQDNLLFKIRMTENAYQPGVVRLASYRK